MDPTAADGELACPDCGVVDEPTATYRCPACDSPLSLEDAGDDGVEPEDLDDEHAGQRRLAPFLPFAPEDVVSLGEGGTPLVACPSLADELGVGRVLVKDEGRNPTGSVADRGLSLAITDAAARDVEAVALPTTGHGGQAAAAFAGRAGLGSQSFVPTRSSHLTKAMVNVHGGDMTVVEGRYPDAVDRFEAWLSDRRDESGDAEGPGADGRLGESTIAVDGASPFRREGAKLLAHELFAQLEWTPPDAVVYPTGHGVGLAGARAALAEAREGRLLEESPRLVAAQPEGCAPIVRALDEDGGHGAWERPDTIAGSLEIPDPARGREAVAAVRETDGHGVAVADDDLLAAAVDDTAATGVELGTAGGVGVAAARELADTFDADDTVVLINPVAGSKESDVLRSELMSRGE